MPMQRRFPKQGFKNPFRKEIFAVNLGDLDERFAAGDGRPRRRCRATGLVPRTPSW